LPVAYTLDGWPLRTKDKILQQRSKESSVGERISDYKLKLMPS
jgi:hypothetical protein